MTQRNKPRRTGNGFLDRTPAEERERLLAHCDRVSFGAREELYRPGASVEHVFFPLSGVYSLLLSAEDGRAVEAATVGSEGLVGLSAILGIDFNAMRATTQVPGSCLRIPVAPFLSACRGSHALDNLSRLYTAISWRNANQTILCNLLHPSEERLAKWLLQTCDRTAVEDLPLTQEALAQMLGVRRQTVTAVARSLQSAGLITYRRGVLRVVNRDGLEQAACECYRTMRDFFRRVMHTSAN
jgi:CRP-like cAMP-binding protein